MTKNDKKCLITKFSTLQMLKNKKKKAKCDGPTDRHGEFWSRVHAGRKIDSKVWCRPPGIVWKSLYYSQDDGFFTPHLGGSKLTRALARLFWEW